MPAALWRAVEALHVVATRALVGSLAEPELLEALLEHCRWCSDVSRTERYELRFAP
ncbi:MAG: hypothetical protein ACREU2_02355 [Steroidobacteraceae bacterium]